MTSPSSQRESPVTTGETSVATLLTWFVPGAGHLYLGRPAFALAVFVLIEGLYLVGLKLSGGMGFEFLHHELRAPFAPVLAPEIGNLGGFLWQMKSYGFGPGEPRPWPEWIHLGVALTALSGVLNVCLMAQAHADAARPRSLAPKPDDWRRSPATAVFLTWLVPGLGHVFQGRRARGVMVFATLVGLMVLGTVLAEGSNLSRERHYYYWGGQFLGGLPALVMEALHGHTRVTGAIAYAEAGLVMAAVAGLLNVLAMLDVYGYGEPRYVHADGERAEAASSRAGATA